MLFPDDDNKSVNGNSELIRLLVPYVNKSDKFKFKTLDYSKQFAHIYASRLNQMSVLMKEKIHQKWGDKYPVKRLVELCVENQEKAVIIGTIFKSQSLKPSILREISEENQLAPQPTLSHFVDEADKLILEDDLHRIRLVGKLNVHDVVTGVVCAVLGYEDCDGKFHVEDYVFYDIVPQKSLKLLKETPLLVILSGLDQSSSNDFSLSLELFQQWIYGNLPNFGSSRDYEAARVVRIIIAGNSIRSSKENLQRIRQVRKQQTSNKTLEAVKSLDKILHNWSKSIYVDLMSGEFDLSNHMMPQQPMHQCMFPLATKYESFTCVTNPYACELADRFIVGTSGQNIQDVSRFSKITDPLDALRATLNWNHIAPTCPDTLACYPYYESDPFIMESRPHVYFGGNSDEFKTDLCKTENGSITRLICVPKFSETQCVAVVNLRTLDCQKLSFKINEFDDEEE